jgi:hypothetical protein
VLQGQAVVDVRDREQTQPARPQQPQEVGERTVDRLHHVLEDIAGDDKVVEALEPGIDAGDVQVGLAVQEGVGVVDQLGQETGIGRAVAQAEAPDGRVRTAPDAAEAPVTAEQLGREQVDERAVPQRGVAPAAAGILAVRDPVQWGAAGGAADVALEVDQGTGLLEPGQASPIALVEAPADINGPGAVQPGPGEALEDAVDQPVEPAPPGRGAACRL